MSIMKNVLLSILLMCGLHAKADATTDAEMISFLTARNGLTQITTVDSQTNSFEATNPSGKFACRFSDRLGATETNNSGGCDYYTVADLFRVSSKRQVYDSFYYVRGHRDDDYMCDRGYGRPFADGLRYDDQANRAKR